MSVIAILLVVVSAGKDAVVEFDNEVIPVLTKAGCNAGACHGAAVGRGGFKLSLYGGDPEADYQSIVLKLEGRRVNLARPDQSLIFLKPTELIEHGGGYRLEYDGAGAELLLKWIRQGTPRVQSRHLKRFEVSPKSHVADHAETTLQLKSQAHFSDGASADVTRWTVFTAEDPTAVEIDKETATAKLLRRGRHIVVARYLDQVVPIELTVPLSDQPVDLAGEPRRNFIDDHVLDLLATLRLPASSGVNDATFLRRATLDLTGRLPALETSRAFLDDESPDKREKLIDRLMESDEFTEYWTYKLAELLRIRSQPQDTQGARTYHQWLKSQVASAVPYDQLARDILTASGDTHQVGPANFYRTVPGPREQAEFTSELFMGNRLRCANCHNHPLDRWTQDDYHGLSAIFAKIDRGRTIKINRRGEVTHPRTGEAAIPRIPGEQFLEGSGDGRQALAEWLTDPNNPYFAKAIVNRLWKAMLGRGLVEPTDDLRATNPATHPALLNLLAEDFVQHEYDLRHTLRRIALSATYARSAVALPRNRADDRYYSHALQRPLPPEVLADAISDVTGVADRYGNEPLGTRAISLFDAKIPSQALDILGRCSREDSCEAAVESIGGLPRKLHLFNGPLLNRRISDPQARLAKLIDVRQPVEKIVKEFYLRALVRPPSPREKEFWARQIALGSETDNRREILEDFVWSLLTCREFVTNH